MVGAHNYAWMYEGQGFRKLALEDWWWRGLSSGWSLIKGFAV